MGDTKTKSKNSKNGSLIAPRVRSVRSAKDKLTRFIKPMLASIHDEPFDGDDWIFEIKWDGYRAVAEISKGEVKLYVEVGNISAP